MEEKQELLASVVLLAEDTGEKNTQAAIDNVLEQTYENFEMVVATLFDNSKLKEKYQGNWQIKFVDAEPGAEIFNNIIKKTKGDIIFYKTVTNVLWFPRHISVHVNELNKKKRSRWCLSHIEYRDIDNPDHPLNTIGYRIGNPPPPNKVILDEICHYRTVESDWTKCVVEKEGNHIFLPGMVLEQWIESEIEGSIPPEITVVQWIKFGENAEDATSEDEVAKNIGKPARTDVNEENKFIDGNVEVVRMFPTIMGNTNLDEEYNNKIREVVSSTQGIQSIGLKRTIGMGDVVLVEPIIKKLKQKYPEAKLTLYTAKSEVVKYFVNQPDKVVSEGLDESSLLNDILSDKGHQLNYDLDLAYESRLNTPFIDAYAAVCGIEFDDYRDKYPKLVDTLQQGIGFEKPMVVVCGDGSGWVGKTWGEANYKEVVKYLQEKGYEVVEPGFSDFSGLTDKKWHKTDFDTLVTLLYTCEFYIGTDNGPMHIARGFNKPCIIIAGAALPYYSNPNREEIFYVQDNSLDCLGCKHKQFFALRGEQLTFVPPCIQEEQGLCLKKIGVEHVKHAIDKFIDSPDSLFTGKSTKFYFNIPGFSYYRESETDLIQRENPEFHPDQEKDISEEYSGRWEELYREYSVPFINEVKKHKETGRLLDIGCNIGLVVKAGIAEGFDAYGTDINTPSIQKCHELFPELKGRVAHPEYAEREWYSTWDVITCNQTLEHISDPVKFLTNITKLLKEDGLLFIGIPSFDEEGAMEKFHQWQTMGSGEHTWISTNKSFEWLMNKVGLKFEHLQDTKKGIFVKTWIR